MRHLTHTIGLLAIMTSITAFSAEARPPAAEGVPTTSEAGQGSVATSRSDPFERRKWHLMPELVAEAPFFLGGRLELELPWRIHVGTFVATMPGPTHDLVETIVRESVTGPTADDVAFLSRIALENTFVVRGFVGWSPLRQRGFYLVGGYSFVHMGGDLTSGEIIEQTLGSVLDPINGAATLNVGLHGLHGEVGYRFFVKKVIIRVSLGFTGTIATQTGLTVESDLGQAEAQQVADDAAAAMEGYLQQYALMPTLGLSIGYDIGL